jgi:hypothetical protein
VIASPSHDYPSAPAPHPTVRLPPTLRVQLRLCGLLAAIIYMFAIVVRALPGTDVVASRTHGRAAAAAAGH